MGLKLDIGCSKRPRKGYVGVDKYQPGAAMRVPAHELPCEDESVEEIYTSHMVEHLPPQEFDLALKEWHRVLMPGGKLTIRCPNFELYVKEWLEGDYAHRWGWGIRNLLGWQDRGPGYLNRNAFTVRRLEECLPQYGFEIIECETTRTRAEKGPEYRPDGDIVCRAVKVPR